LVAFLRRSLLRPLLALGLCLCLGLSGCSQTSAGLSGNYVDDTVSVAQSLLSTIALAQEDPSRQESEAEARRLINSYTALYRPRQDVHRLASFTTMQTAVNALAAHYAGYTNRPLPEALLSRLEKELKKAEASVVRGA
jgi:photosystem II Psb27 protein